MPLPLIGVVEHEKSVRELFTDVLEEEGYRVVSCASQAEALGCIRSSRPDVVILDPWMETQESGWEVWASLDRDPATATIPIIVCTTITERISPPDSLQTSPVAVLDKPFLIEDLLIAIRTALAL